MHKQRQYRGGYEFSGLVKLARELRKNQTSAETLLWNLLRGRKLLGLKFRRQHQLGKYVADFYCREAQLVIECDGSAHRGNEQWQHDQNRDAYMISQGIRVMRFRNAEIWTKLTEFFLRSRSILPKDEDDKSFMRSLTFQTLALTSPKGRGNKPPFDTGSFSTPILTVCGYRSAFDHLARG